MLILIVYALERFHTSTCVTYYLFEVDTLATSIGSSQYLHSTMIKITTCVIRYKRCHTQLLEWMSEIGGGGHCVLCPLMVGEYLPALM